MHDFVLKEITNADLNCELEKIGFDKTYIHRAVDKFQYLNIKVYALTPPQANILKQTALSVGADCATHRETITAKIEKTDCILGGSKSQLYKIAEKLKAQPFGMKILGDKISAFLSPAQRAKTKIAGILNITQNSFSDGGMYFNTENACEHLIELINDGADIIDIGAESTKPFSSAVSAEEQLNRLLPVLNFAGEKNINVPISIDTRSSLVAEECIKAGAKIINDVSGLEYDEKMAKTVAKYGVKIIIQHTKGTPENMQVSPHYDSVMDEIYSDLKKRIDYAVSCGIAVENIIVDPGIGFGKTREDNFEIIRRVEELYGLGCPVMLGVSRKSLLNMADKDNLTKDIFTVALNALAVERKVDYIRVHNVKLHKELLNLCF